MCNVNNAVYFKYCGKVVYTFEVTTQETATAAEALALVLQKYAKMGYTFEPEVVIKMLHISADAVYAFDDAISDIIVNTVGADKVWQPLYKGFPESVKQSDKFTHRIDACVYALKLFYGDILTPEIREAVDNYITTHMDKAETRPKLNDFHDLKLIKMGTYEDYVQMLKGYLCSKTVLPNGVLQDVLPEVSKLHVAERIDIYKEVVLKVHKAQIITMELQNKQIPTITSKLVGMLVHSVTDILRIIDMQNGGSGEFDAPVRYKHMSRKQRRFYMQLIADVVQKQTYENVLMEMATNSGKWIRVGEVIHPQEYKSRQYADVRALFQALRNTKCATFNGKVDRNIGNVDAQLKLLETRPGVYVRQVLALLKYYNTDTEATRKLLNSIHKILPKVSTVVQLQLLNRVNGVLNAQNKRLIMLKGTNGKYKVIDTEMPINSTTLKMLQHILQQSLEQNYAQKEYLGACYIDEALKAYKIPIGMRGIVEGTKQVARGTTFSINDATQVVRCFTWWENVIDSIGFESDTDIDLSAVCLNAEYKLVDTVNYCNLKTVGITHSGDVRSAPRGVGGSEYIDVDISALNEANAAREVDKRVRYVVLCIQTYTEESFKQIDGVLFGYMERQDESSGQIYEPTTLENSYRYAGDSRYALTIVLDVEKRKIIVLTVGLRERNINNVIYAKNKENPISTVTEGIVESAQLTLYDLFKMHVHARGYEVSTRDDAETVFANDGDVTAYDVSKIMSEYL
jgi:stress response protein SCP2